jgi:phosphatidylserine/phosphatidylglycerophosphate/cardiolipin synthase-like enzyme
MKLIVQPDDGLKPLLRSVQRAKRTIDLVIFRFDIDPLERELEAAVKRGVAVRALVANTNRGGKQSLRKLERRMLKAGVTVARTDNDLVRYHGKLLIIDDATLYVLGFNYTTLDIKSRSFGVVTRNRRVVREALRLVDNDGARKPFTPRVGDLVVSPENARGRLNAFIRKARRSLDIYDPQLTDDEMIALLERRALKGVRVRILGKLEKKWIGRGLDARKFPGRRLHVRAIVRDGRRVFIGSQSLRKLELDERREVGLIVRNGEIVRRVERIFRQDWKLARPKPTR